MDKASTEQAYVSPLATRFATRRMLENFSQARKFRTWRRVWVALAEAQKELGLPVSEEQIAELRAHQDDLNLEKAREYERKLRHDIMAHVRAYGDQCPRARPIIHLGATSCDVSDNADIILIRDGLELLTRKLANVIDRLAAFAEKYRSLPTLGWTHYQPAQLTTVGKRACLWTQDLVLDLEEIERLLGGLRLRGIKGATGSQASFLQLFDGDHAKVERLERLVAQKLGFHDVFPVTGQTYTRKLDARTLATLSGIGQSAHKFANDVRLLQHLGEIQEPFEETQVGSSSMPYKRNPMRCERITGLARFLICLAPNAAFTAASQWLERTLDDSSNRRLSLPEAFLTADAILHIVLNVVSGLVVRPGVIGGNLERELPMMASEGILMAAVKRGGDRQELHERIRKHAMAAVEAVRGGGAEYDLLDRIRRDEMFAAVRDELPALTDPTRFVGRAPEQVRAFVQDVVEPIRKRYAAQLGLAAELQV